ncbi:hypothetical protein LHYA1_G001685 [Lachnellula hyalina]|uniref:Uncharacterized protein n=1 Tax=Lachnellula hyalina TaxID=1316788 RepID=A0A8H8R792_9HELO|nr:uncharacterized protein LHYA1_G001685 [Lachnellula hyalina]TVY28896.1 hypothetical protein LHYA1_G001685 [Lachnellula hyalina]
MSNNDRNSPPAEGPRQRRSSVTQQTLNNLFGGRSNSTSGAPTAALPGPITIAVAQDQRRRMSISTLGLSGTSPTQQLPMGARRSSISTAGSDSIDENAIDDEDGPARSNPNTPFARRMSFGTQALRRAQPGGSPGTGTNGTKRSSSYTTAPALPTIPSGPRSSRSGSGNGGGTTPPQVQNQPYQASTQSKPRTASDLSVSARPGEGGGFNWSEQLRSRAESSVSQSQRPSFSNPTSAAKQPAQERQKSVSEMPAPPSVVPAQTPPKPARKQPDAFQERILKGDFYMD